MSTRQRASRDGFRLERIQHAVAEALELTLLPGLADPELRDLHVIHVEVSKGLASIHVLLTSEYEVEGLATSLKRVEPYLRSELAEILLIKKVPTLTLERRHGNRWEGDHGIRGVIAAAKSGATLLSLPKR